MELVWCKTKMPETSLAPYSVQSLEVALSNKQERWTELSYTLYAKRKANFFLDKFISQI